MQKNVVSYSNKKIFAHEMLQMYRGRLHVTQAELARLLGFKSFRIIQYWESGQNLPRPDSLRKYVTLLVEKGLFTVGQELREARELWSTIKNASDTRLDAHNSMPYPAFDEPWFEFLLTRREDELDAIPPAYNRSVTWDEPPKAEDKSLKNNLPEQLTSFVGRSEELAEVRRLIGQHRLVTLVGMGGVGKTRLALEAVTPEIKSAKAKAPWKDGIWLVELSSIMKADLELVAKEMARALAMPVQKEPLDFVETVLNHLRSRQLLLILDSCEHLVQLCSRLVNTLLERCPQVSILATSREALRLGAEIVYPVHTLKLPPLPESADLTDLAELGENESVQLFIERAKTVQSWFELDSKNALQLIKICRKLEGLPLAIELAAVRTTLLSITQIADRLTKRFQLLTMGDRARLPRQQTLRATLDWSYELLTQEERILLHRLTSFTSSWTLEEAEKICVGDGLEDYRVMDLLQQLVSKSLVLVVSMQDNDNVQEVHYRLLDTIREYIQECQSGPSA